MSAYQIREFWKGFAALRALIIFGDSYSSTTLMGYNGEMPTSEDPMSVRFPGETWNEPGLPNWVGHLITKYCPQPGYKPDEDQDEEWTESPLLIYNYAKGGDTVAGVCRQVEYWFLPNVGKKPEWAQWTSEASLFVSWVGINDCAYTCDAPHAIATLFIQQQKLYDAGARNFLFLDVPPIHRSPAVPDRPGVVESIRSKTNAWNAALREGIQTFASTHEDTTCLLFSANRIFNDLLDDPASFGLPGAAQQSDFWVDHIHPTSKVHDALAKSIGEFLSSVDTLRAGDE